MKRAVFFHQVGNAYIPICIYHFFKNTKDELTQVVTNLALEKAKSKYSARFTQGFVYEFSQGDLDRIQEMINLSREEISKTSNLTEEHKQRVLKKLEGLQSELHKKVSDLDKCWGFIGELGVVAGKFGEDTKPFVDMAKEMASIVWKTQARAEELPSASEPTFLNNDVSE